MLYLILGTCGFVKESQTASQSNEHSTHLNSFNISHMLCSNYYNTTTLCKRLWNYFNTKSFFFFSLIIIIIKYQTWSAVTTHSFANCLDTASQCTNKCITICNVNGIERHLCARGQVWLKKVTKSRTYILPVKAGDATTLLAVEAFPADGHLCVADAIHLSGIV